MLVATGIARTERGTLVVAATNVTTTALLVATGIARTERGTLIVVPIRSAGRTARGTARRTAVRTAVRIAIRVAVRIIIRSAIIRTEIGTLVIITRSSRWIDLQYKRDVKIREH